MLTSYALHTFRCIHKSVGIFVFVVPHINGEYINKHHVSYKFVYMGHKTRVTFGKQTKLIVEGFRCRGCVVTIWLRHCASGKMLSPRKKAKVCVCFARNNAGAKSGEKSAKVTPCLFVHHTCVISLRPYYDIAKILTLRPIFAIYICNIIYSILCIILITVQIAIIIN